MPTKTAKPKKTTAAPPPELAAPAEFQPVRIAKSTTTGDPGIPIFYIGDDEYRIPTKVPRSAVLEFLRLSRTDGEMSAAQRLLERLLGPAAYLALEQSDDVDDEALDTILRAVIHHMAGETESGKA
ncbi:hypothetical protein [Streptomyces sp. CB03911]|uniref:hypothetical protein n=1 Tax=Streptomyces sp. CB03911 TaxID=1804758 RepID=UPI00093CB501|nr:hypothetical protein [Streptomyces sp. CB03911]OKI16630.1 hypothetical protein A6A07_11525 [Streptomyces sp. CB03911]